MAGVAVIVGAGFAGAVFYGALTGRYLTTIVHRILGPYSDALAAHVFSDPDPKTLRRLAMDHQVTIIFNPAAGEVIAFDPQGEGLSTSDPDRSYGQISAPLTAANGDQVVFYWNLGSFWTNHLPLLAGFVTMLAAIVGAAFWFLQRQLKPLARLQSGVNAVARGELDSRVPVVRNDEIGQITAAFNKMTSRVGDMINDRERLLADVSHELRSPITRMKVALELMPEGTKREALARDLKEMENLVTALLEREELRSRVDRFEGEDIELRPIIAEVITAAANQQPAVELDSNVDARLVADPVLVKLLLKNLVDNAIKFSLPDSRPIFIKLEVEKETIILRVVDDGIGIPLGSEERVFEPFVKLDRARSHHVGYGIGLNLCQRIVKLHGGSICLRALQPRGTEAIVTLSRKE
jgi:signal transduction histidine kinase